MRWNRTNSDWINASGADSEVGCIHTTQGYDLNYTGIIFGNEIRYDKVSDTVVIDKDNYFDRNGKQGIQDSKALRYQVIGEFVQILD